MKLLAFDKEGLPQTLRKVGLFVAISVAVALPWYLRAYLATGNPVFPLANDLFGGVYASSGAHAGELSNRASLVVSRLSMPALKDWISFLWDTSVNPDQIDTQRRVGIFFLAFLPYLLLLRGRRIHLYLLLCCAVYYLGIYLFLKNIIRFALVAVALMSLSVGCVVEDLLGKGRWVRKVVLFVVVVNGLSTLLWISRLTSLMLPVVLGIESEEAFLTRREPNYAVFQYVNQNTPKSAVVLLQGIVRTYYCDRRFLIDHPWQTVVQYQPFKNADEMYGALRSLGVTHVVRMSPVPPIRLKAGYPQYDRDKLHGEFTRRYLKRLFARNGHVVYEMMSASG